MVGLAELATQAEPQASLISTQTEILLILWWRFWLMPSNQFLIGWLVEEVEWVAGDMEVGVAIKWCFGIFFMCYRLCIFIANLLLIILYFNTSFPFNLIAQLFNFIMIMVCKLSSNNAMLQQEKYTYFELLTGAWSRGYR